MLLSVQRQYIFTAQYSSIPRLLTNFGFAIVSTKSFIVLMFYLPGIFNAVYTKIAEATTTPIMLLYGRCLSELLSGLNKIITLFQFRSLVYHSIIAQTSS